MDTNEIGQITPGPESSNGNGNSKKVIIAVIVVIVFGVVAYTFAGGGLFQGRISRDIATPKGEATREKTIPRVVSDQEESSEVTGKILRGKKEDSDVKIVESEAAEAAAEAEAAAKAEEEAKAAAEVEAVDKAEEEAKAAAEAEAAAKAEEEAKAAAEAEAAAKAEEKAKAAAEAEAAAKASAFQFNTSSFEVSTLLEPLKGGGFNAVSSASVMRYAEGSAENSYRITFNMPTYSGENFKNYYKFPVSAVICNNNTCASAHTEERLVSKNEDSVYSYLTVTRGELYTAVQELGVSSGEVVELAIEVKDPDEKPYLSGNSFKRKIEDDAVRIPFNLEGFKLKKGSYVKATDGDFIQLDYNQTNGKTIGEIIYFYTGDEDTFKFIIEICDPDNNCANYLEMASGSVASIGGSYQIKVSDLKAFTDGLGFMSGTPIKFRIAVKEITEGAQQHYAQSFYNFVLP